MNAPKKRGHPAKEIGGGSLPPSSHSVAHSPLSGGHPRNAPGEKDTLGIQAANWPEIQLATRCTVKSSTRIFQKEYVDNGIPFMRSKDVIDKALGQFAKFEMFISSARYREIKAVYGSPEKGDLLLSSVGNRSGIPYVVQNEGEFYFKDGNIIWLSNFSEIDSDYLAYWMKSDFGQDKLASVMIGSAQKALTIDSIRKLWVRLPPFNIQTAISKILKSLDDKIALNRRINQTLEAMAQALFQSWFVDFDPVKAKQQTLDAGGTAQAAELAAMQVISGKSPAQLKVFHKQQPEPYAELERTAKLFPSKLVESELGFVPEGWEVKALARLISLTGGGTPKRSEPTFWNGEIPWYSVKDAPSESDVFVVDTDEHISQKGLNESSTRLLPKGTTIISARGTVGKLALVATPMCMNQSCYGVNGSEGIGAYYNYFNLKKAIGDLQQKVHGAVFDTITTSTFETCYQSFSGEILANNFNSIVSPLLERIESNVRSNLRLTEARDSLLPKLLSGEINVSRINVVGNK